MKFELRTTGYFYRDEEHRAKLAKLGFKFILSTHAHCWVMEDSEVFIELDTLEELIEFINDWEACIVSSSSIEIYDDYRE